MFDNDEDMEIIKEFLDESTDSLENIEPLLIGLQSETDEHALFENINLIFRSVHTIKGSAGFLHFNQLVRLTHAAESLLGYFRESKVRPLPEHLELILHSMDQLRELIKSISLCGNDEDEQNSVNIETLVIALQKALAGLEQTQQPCQEPTPMPNYATPENEDNEDDFQPPLDEELLQDEVLNQFYNEGIELLNEAENALIKLNADINDAETLQIVMQYLHTFKGNCGFLSLVHMQKISHLLESIVIRAGDGEITDIQGVINHSLLAVDILKESLANFCKTHNPAIEGYAGLKKQLKNFLENKEEKIKQSTESIATPESTIGPTENTAIDIMDFPPTFSTFISDIREQAQQEDEECAVSCFNAAQYALQAEKTELSKTLHSLHVAWQNPSPELQQLTDDACNLFEDFLFELLNDLDADFTTDNNLTTNLEASSRQQDNTTSSISEDPTEKTPTPHPLIEADEATQEEKTPSPLLSQQYDALIYHPKLEVAQRIQDILTGIKVPSITCTEEEEVNALINAPFCHSFFIEHRLLIKKGGELIQTLRKKSNKNKTYALCDDLEKAQYHLMPFSGLLNANISSSPSNELIRQLLQYKEVNKKSIKGVHNTSLARREIKVDLNKLDTLINLVGELIIAEAMVVRNPDLSDEERPNFDRACHRLHLITNEIQDVAMAVRMVPISGVFKKMIRLVHDLASKSGKKIELILLGENTEVDKSVVDLLADPLVHMLRNSADHGLESNEERLAAGKTEPGTITLEAEQRGNEVLISLRDNGAGLDRQKIIAKANTSGLIAGDGEKLSDQEAYSLIFEPGFSTAAAITDISGRGVGMDVVKKNIEKMKGRIEIQNSPGEGVCFIIRIPLSLATIEGMLIRVGQSKYTIPITAIRESLRPDKDSLHTRHDGREFVKIREEILPVYRLHQIHQRKADKLNLEDGILITVDLYDGPACIFVDEILYQIQTVVKTLSGEIGSIPGISGFNILGNGEVSLILDMENLIRHANQEHSNQNHEKKVR